MKWERNEEEPDCINQTTTIHGCPYTHTAPIKCSVQRKATPHYERPCMALCHGLPSQHWQGKAVAAAGAGTSTAGSPQVLWYHPTAICSLGLSAAQTQQIFFTRCRSNPAPSLRDPPSFPQTHCNCRHKNWAGRLPMNGSINCQSHRETTTCCSTALLWLLTHPVNLLAWLELWRMWALPAFPRVSNDAGKAAMTIYCTVKYCWQNTPTLDKDGSSLVYTFLPQTLKVRDTKLPVLWHAPPFQKEHFH